jgi:hypothetical protein
METRANNTSIRWFLDGCIVIACIILYLLLFKYVLANALDLEREVWARVLQADESKDGYVLVEFFYEGQTYKKSINSRDTLKPREVVSLQFFGWNPEKADWYSHNGGHGPYTSMAIFLFFTLFFIIIIPPVVLWKKYFKGRKPLPLSTILILFSRFASIMKSRQEWLIQKTGPSILGLVYPLIGFLIICIVGFTGQTICGHFSDPRNFPKGLAEAYLSAILHGNINAACTLVYPEQRYEFLTNIHRWKLKEYKIVSDAMKQGDEFEYFSKWITISSSDPSIYTVIFEHDSTFDNKAIQGSAVIGLAYHVDWFYVKTGYLPGINDPGSDGSQTDKDAKGLIGEPENNES